MLHVVTLSRETVQSSMRVETMKRTGKKLSVIQEILSMQQKFLSQQLMFRTGDNVFGSRRWAVLLIVENPYVMQPGFA